MISFSGVNKSFGGKHVLKNISFTIDTGEAMGIVGPNGAGKTTIINLLLGFLKPDSGSITCNEIPVWENKSTVVGYFGVVQENPTFFPEFNARQNLDYFADLLSVSRERVDVLISKVGLDNSPDTVFSKYSMGMKQRLNIAFSLLNDPDILIFDEPTNGLDPVGISDIRRLIQEFSKEGKTIILCSHILSEVEKICNHSIVIKNGEVVDKIRIRGGEDEKLLFQIKHDNIKKVTALLEKTSGFHVVFADDVKCIVEIPSSQNGSTLNRLLVEKNIYVSEIYLSNNFESDVLEKINK